MGEICRKTQIICRLKKNDYLCSRKSKKGTIAQLVEHRTENPCVRGSNPRGTTIKVYNVLKISALSLRA